MKIYHFGIMVIFGLATACGRSPDSQFYILNPILPQQTHQKGYEHLRIGINKIHRPDYMDKPQLIIHLANQEVKLQEYHRWVESLAQNTQHVIEANLKALLPGAVLLSAPWDVKLKPDYQLQIDIQQFEVDINGASRLTADYLIYSDNHLNKKGSLVYFKRITPPSTINLVATMNANLTQFTRDLAKILIKL
ncbi:MAG: membrane integrity-associated transporter subunit PqiC [Tatlockia sp.]|nr:membrane integrity-associated transporter subunit PqiC [Tatlockia sp.]